MKIEVIHIDVGNKVFCDLCGKEYTDDEKSCGGFLFNGNAVCPDCADDFFKTIKIYKEEDYITIIPIVISITLWIAGVVILIIEYL